jgi:hypothetical protein
MEELFLRGLELGLLQHQCESCDPLMHLPLLGFYEQYLFAYQKYADCVSLSIKGQ